MMSSHSQLLVFDLDGTLADTKRDIAASVNATLQAMKCPTLPESLIISFVGEGSKKLLMRSLKHLMLFDEEVYQKAIAFYLEHYYQNVCQYTSLYPKVEETLSHLPFPKVVLTNKPSKIAKKLLDALKISHYFQEILGGDVSDKLKPNPQYLLELMEKHKVSANNTWMIGDSDIDIHTARNAKVKSIAVLYGFFPKETLLELHPDYTISQFDEIIPLVCQHEV